MGAKRWPAAARKGVMQTVLWFGLILIGILAIPTGILFAAISAVWSVTDKLIRWMEKK